MQSEEKNVKNTLIFAFRKVIVHVTPGCIHTIKISYCTIFFIFLF